MQHCKFFVDNKPYCVWEWDLRERNIEFLNGIDPYYFEYIAKLCFEQLKTNDKQYAAVMLRNSYVHGLETLFAFLCTTIQAPDCIIGWLQKYKLSQLRNIINSVSKKSKKLYSKLNVHPISWNNLSNLIIQIPMENPEKIMKMKNEFGKLWQRFAKDFLDKKIYLEYNNIKHGFRVRPGGCKILIGNPTKKHGPPSKPKNMHLMGGSDYGTTFYLPEFICSDKKFNINFRIRKNTNNWNPENLINGLSLISNSLKNIISFLKVVNGVNTDKVKSYPPSIEDFSMLPWKNSIGMFGFNMDTVVKECDITPFTKEDIINELKNKLKK